MDTRTYETARVALVRRQREIMVQRAHDVGEVARLLVPETGDPVDMSTLQREAGLLDLFSALELRELHEIEAALRRLEAGTYGRCFGCGGEIEPQRLAAIPTTTLCRACAEAEAHEPPAAPVGI
jgi:DnaK suppressor protein